MTRDALLDAAEEVFAARGVASATMAEIATVAGFSRGAIYAHFGTKDDLLLAMLDRYVARQIEQFSALVPNTDLAAGARGASDVFARTASRDLVPLELELRLNATRNPSVRMRLAEADDRVSEQIARVIQEQLGPGARLKIPARDLGEIGRAAVMGLMQYEAVDEDHASRYGQLVEALFLLLASAVEPAGEPDRDRTSL
jgi:AcrR family transcriptional regulator